MHDAIVVQSLGKQFYRYHTDRPVTWQEAVLGGLRRMRPAECFWALRDIDIKVAPGTMLGVIGHNGAGKSTLLRLIGGVGKPDEGKVQVHGRIGALLDLGAGFHPDLTGRENVFVNGVIAGLTRREVAERFDSIVEFAELGDFIDNPLRTYSTGMKMRLAFAVAAHIEPEILLVDEVLAVGDLAFQRKCLDRIAQFKTQGVALMFVSHDAALVRELCDEVLWLREGQVVAYGAADVVVGQYITEMTVEAKRRTPTVYVPRTASSGVELRVNENRFGSLEMEIIAVHLLNAEGFPVAELNAGDSLRVEIEYMAPEPIDSPIFGVTIIREEDELICYDPSTASDGLNLSTIQGKGKVILQLDRLDLNDGMYYVNVWIYEQSWAHAYDFHWCVYPLSFYSNSNEKGILRPPHYWEVEGMPSLKTGLPSLEISSLRHDD